MAAMWPWGPYLDCKAIFSTVIGMKHCHQQAITAQFPTSNDCPKESKCDVFGYAANFVYLAVHK